MEFKSGDFFFKNFFVLTNKIKEKKNGEDWEDKSAKSKCWKVHC